MADTAFAGATALDIITRVRDGRWTATEVLDAHLSHADTVNDVYGAFHRIRHDEARSEAAAIDAPDPRRRQLPLAGVPIAVKDNVSVAGEPMRLGSRATRSAPSAEDHPVVALLRASGAVIMGLTHVPELCLWGTCDSAFGTARSPWHRSRTAGGSSGGSAAAVAGAMVPVAHGNDGLGSLRIPAACCGLIGIKPGHGVVPAALGANSWYGIAENGVLATTTADAALMLSVMAGKSSLADVTAPAAPLRIALAIAPPAPGLRVDVELAEKVRSTAAILSAHGHRVTEVNAPVPSPLEVLGILGTWGAGARNEVNAFLAGDASAWGRLERRTRGHVRMGAVADRLGLASERHRASWRKRLGTFMDGFDLLMTPTLARHPLAAEGWRSRGWLANLVANLTWAPYCGSVNYARLPAIAVPAGVHADGTPASVHFVAPEGGERLLLGVASLVERMQPWRRHAPQVDEALTARRIG